MRVGQEEELQKAVAPNIPLLPAAFQAWNLMGSEGPKTGRLWILKEDTSDMRQAILAAEVWQKKI